MAIKAKAPDRPRVSLATSLDQCGEGTEYVWKPNSEKQIQALWRQEFEIFFGGAKGGGKSFCGIGWLINGNPWVPLDQASPTDLSYIENPLYRGLALRKNHIDLANWIDKARDVYRKLGADYVDGEFRFRSGAKIVTGHLKDEDAYEKYFGHEVHRIFIDELTFIADRKLYLRILSCLRSTVPGIRPQVFCTGNPGGPGTRWVKDRFITPRAKDGRVIPPMTTLAETHYNPVLDQKVRITRIFIPSKVTDNPDLMKHDPLYMTRLMMLPETERRAYLDGDWDALSGQFFSEWRPNGPIGNEQQQYPWARHVIKRDSIELLPYWHRWIGMDWGYAHDSAVFWACQHPNGQVIIYREAVVSKVGAEELGALIARESLPDLAGLQDRHMVLHLSPDAFARRDDTNTIAEQIARGISRIMGRDSAFLVDFTDEERLLPSDQAWESLQRRQRDVARRAGITIERANNERVNGWSQVREFLRWKPIYKVSSTIDYKVVEDLQIKGGIMAAAEYMKAVMDQKNEILPKLLVLDSCPRLMRGISEAQHDEGRPEDVLKNEFDNEVDALRYTCAVHTGAQTRKPMQYAVEEAVAALPAGASGHTRYMTAVAAESAHSKHTAGKAFMLPRRTGRHARLGALVQ